MNNKEKAPKTGKVTPRRLEQIVVRFFSFIWRKWLVNEWESTPDQIVFNKVEIVTGWRSAYVGIYSRHGYRKGREHQAFCPKIWRWYLP